MGGFTPRLSGVDWVPGPGFGTGGLGLGLGSGTGYAFRLHGMGCQCSLGRPWLRKVAGRKLGTRCVVRIPIGTL